MSSTKNTSASASTSTTAVAGMIDFLTLARGLKTTPRTGWVRQEAGPRIESVADHSWRIALMSMVASSSAAAAAASDSPSSASPSPQFYDANRCIKMALVHDLAEAVVGDITPHCGVTDQDKHAQELAAITAMTQKLVPVAATATASAVKEGDAPGGSIGASMVGHEILELWKEYEAGTTPEAKLVKDMDKLEMTLQALEYENDGKNGKSLDGFFDSTRGKWRTEIGKAWGDEIESRRKKNADTASAAVQASSREIKK